MKDDRTGQDVAGVAALAGLDAPTADAIPEARATAAKDIYDAMVDGPTDEADLRGWLAVVRAVDASRPKAPTERTFPRVILGSVAPGSLIEIVSGDIGLVLDGCYGEAPRYVAWITTGHVGTMPATSTVSLRATSAELDALTSADAGRPGLTLEQSRAWVERRFPSLVGHAKQCCIEIAVRASRGETGPARVICRRCQSPRANGRCLCGEAGDELAWLPGDRGYPTPERGETGPAPTWGEQAIAEHRRAAQPEPFEKIEQLPSGLTCPGCYAATGIAQPHDPRATLHDGDPQKSGTLAGGGSKND